jgi:lipopolysaccharide transport system ATP-binding protein
MSRPVISVEGLGKEFMIGSRERVGETFREMLTGSLIAPFRRLRRLSGAAPADPEERFWALKDVAFHVEEGEVVGIIGRNGAGKSTLLKILSRIVEPTEGQVTLRGRVASLLEVGTGFHPELTGRENIFLNGAVLGMTRSEIAQKFDEIVAFAEVERFLDTPVKRYSSGMYVRLAFSVAAHLEPEILVVDEVLAVGDIAFQEKCLNKMESTAKGGRTVLFVSHNMHAIARLCSRCVALQGGRVSFDGEVDKCIESYIGSGHRTAEGNVISLSRKASDEFYVDRIEILNGKGKPLTHLKTWDEATFRIVFHSPRNFPAGSVEFQIATASGVPVVRCSTRPDSAVPSPFREGENIIECHFPRLALSAGRYLIGAGLAVPNVEWLYQNLDGGVLEIGARDIFNSGSPPQSSRYVVPMEHNWIVQSAEHVNARSAPSGLSQVPASSL